MSGGARTLSNEARSLFFYHSTLADGHDASCVGAIVRTARAFNASHGITGVLLFDGERFCQYIEGPSPALDALVDRICEDPRHQNVTPLLQGPLSAARRYPDWSMAFSDVGKDSIIDRLIAAESLRALELLQQAHLTLDVG